MEACAGAGSRKAAEKERSYAGAGAKKVKKGRQAGSEKAEERALLMPKNLELDEEKAHAGSKTEKEEKVLQNPMPSEFPFTFEPLPEKMRKKTYRRGMQYIDCESGQSKVGGGKRMKKTYRLGKEYIDYVAENPLPPLYLPDPDPSFGDLGISEPHARFIARQMAEREERDNILKQLEEFGYAEVEVEVPDYDKDPLGRGHGVKTV